MASTPENEMMESTLSILSLYLPDPAGDISAQILAPVKTKMCETFHCFPLLVEELQVKIWRFAFPRARSVQLRPHRFCRIKSHCGHCKCVAKHTAPLPVTLYVNHQSREETLRHYRIVWVSAEAQGTFDGKVKPLCFDPSRDTLYTHFHDMVDCTREKWMLPFIADRYLNRDPFKDVKVLEVRNWAWSEKVIGEYLSGSNHVALEVFTQLDEIRLMLHHPSQFVSKYCKDCRGLHKGRQWGVKDEKKSIEAMKSFFQRIHDDGSVGELTGIEVAEVKIPKVVVLPWTKRQ